MYVISAQKLKHSEDLNLIYFMLEVFGCFFMCNLIMLAAKYVWQQMRWEDCV
jgi:hypothetical protein